MSRPPVPVLAVTAVVATGAAFVVARGPTPAVPTVVDVADLPPPPPTVTTRPGAPGAAPPTVADDAWRPAELGVQIAELAAGVGAPATPGQLCTFDVALWAGEALVATTWTDRTPMKARLGAGQTAPGLEVALLGMAAGQRRAARIPAAAGFGRQGPDGVPDADLTAELALVGCEAPRVAPSAPPIVPPGEGVEVAPGVRVIERAPGQGAEAGPDLAASVELAVWTADGALVDASGARGRPMRVVLGRRAILPALELVITGMRPGGHRVASISAAAAADPAAGPRLPAGDDLLIDVRLVDLAPAP